jgi:hypothetical protein
MQPILRLSVLMMLVVFLLVGQVGLEVFSQQEIQEVMYLKNVVNKERIKQLEGHFVLK